MSIENLRSARLDKPAHGQEFVVRINYVHEIIAGNLITERDVEQMITRRFIGHDLPGSVSVESVLEIEYTPF